MITLSPDGSATITHPCEDCGKPNTYAPPRRPKYCPACNRRRRNEQARDGYQRNK